MASIHDFKGKRVHMAGIGGSSMAGLAELLVQRGYTVTGSDTVESHGVHELRALGIRIHLPQKVENVQGADVLVYSAAIAKDNPERLEAMRLGIPEIDRAQLLAELMEGSPASIAVSGTHGKTSTTAMLSTILLHAGLDPSVHLGGTFDPIGGSTRIGTGPFVAEACEFNGSFWFMRPNVAVILNIEEDHLDFYKDIEDIEASFRRFVSGVPSDGTVVGNGDDARVRAVLTDCERKVITVGLSDGCDLVAQNVTEDALGCARFAVQGVPVTLQVPGRYNIVNALCAMGAALVMDVPLATSAQALSLFQNAHRRFEETPAVAGMRMFHDYGHNPTEMRSALSNALKVPHGRLFAVMQPHTYSRVKGLFDEYIHCLNGADAILITDIFAAREKDPGDIHAKMLVDAMQKAGQPALYTPQFADVATVLRQQGKPGDVVITLGCGDIDKLNAQMASGAI